MRDPLVHHKPLNLVEDRRVRGVHGVGAVDPARHNHADGQLALQHGAHLHRGGLGAQQDVVGDVKGVLRVARRMVARNVEHLKVVTVVFHLGPVHDLVAHAHKNLLDFVEHQVQGVLPPVSGARPGAVTSMRSSRRRCSSTAAATAFFLSSSRVSSSLRSSFAIAPSSRRCCASSLPICFITPESSLFLPSRSMRACSSAARSPACSMTASARCLSCCNVSFMPFHLKTKSVCGCVDVLCVPVAVYGCVWMCMDVLCVPVYGALRRVMRAGGGDTLFDGRGGLPVRTGRAGSGCAAREGGTRRAQGKKGLRGRLAGAPCACAQRQTKKPRPLQKGTKQSSRYHPCFAQGYPSCKSRCALTRQDGSAYVSAHRTEGPGAPHRGLAHRTGGPGAPHRGLAHRTGGLAHRTGGPGAPHRGAWRTAQGPGAGGRVQQSGSGGNFVGRRRRACSQPVTRVLWCTAGGTTFSVMAFGQYLQKNQKAIGVF